MNKMTPSSKSEKSKEKKGVADGVDTVAKTSNASIDTPSRLSLDRQEIARMTEQKIDEIESAIKQDYLKNARAAKESGVMEQSSISRVDVHYTADDSIEANTLLQDTMTLPGHDEEFEPTVILDDTKFSLFNDESEL